MGNRAVITTKERELALYLHWNGGRDTVEPLLRYCELQGYRPPSSDSYGWARMALGQPRPRDGASGGRAPAGGRPLGMAGGRHGRGLRASLARTARASMGPDAMDSRLPKRSITRRRSASAMSRSSPVSGSNPTHTRSPKAMW